MKNLRGKFTLVHQGKTTLVVGLVGNVNAFSLGDDEIKFIAAFYRLFEYKDVECLKTYKCRNSSNYNSFLKFKL